MAGEVEGLEIEIAANLRKVQQNLLALEARYQKSAEKVEQRWQQANRRVEGTGAGIALASATAGRGVSRLGALSQQAGYQIGDFATQVAGGTSALVAFGQQGPQLLGMFGAFGAAAGAAVAIGAALANYFVNTAEKGVTFESAIKGANEAIRAMSESAEAASNDGLKKILDRYGELTAAVELMIARQGELARQQGADVGRQLAEGLRTALGAGGSFLSNDTGDIARTLGIESTVVSFDALGAKVREVNPQIVYLRALLDDIANGDTFTAQADAAARLQTFLEAAGIDGGEVFRQANEAEAALRELAVKAGEAAVAAETLAAVDMASPISAARAEAEGLTDALREAVEASQAALMAQASLNYGRLQNRAGSGADAARREVQAGMVNPFGRLAPGAGGVRTPAPSADRAGGGGGGRAPRPAQDIDARSAALARLADRYGEATQAGQMLSDLQRDLASGFADAIIEGRNFGEVMGGILQRLARQLIELSLVGQNGSGGLLGPLFSAIGGAFGGGHVGARAGGGPVMAGTPYLVNERTPNSEIFVPSRSGAMLNVAQAQTALRGAGGGVTVQNHIHIDARGAVAGVGAEIDAALARRLPDIDRRVLETVRAASSRGRL
ncbi:MAG: hypothetical protein MUF73_06905 [Rhodobacteraceae bacterium]|jgi:hypothetical protein|nr:hypothetical protein [Paracoccaceae bacterium]